MRIRCMPSTHINGRKFPILISTRIRTNTLLQEGFPLCSLKKHSQAHSKRLDINSAIRPGQETIEKTSFRQCWLYTGHFAVPWQQPLLVFLAGWVPGESTAGQRQPRWALPAGAAMVSRRSKIMGNWLKAAWAAWLGQVIESNTVAGWVSVRGRESTYN